MLGGDSHNAWAHEVADEGGRKIACEFDAPAVSAIGMALSLRSTIPGLMHALTFCSEFFGQILSLFAPPFVAQQGANVG